MPIRLSELIKKIPADTEERVFRAKDRMNSGIRDAMRRETGLLLNRRESQDTKTKKGENISVPVLLLPGLPAPLIDMSFDDDDWLAVTISPYRQDVKRSHLGLEGVGKLIDVLLEDPRGNEVVGNRRFTLESTVGLVAELLAIVDGFDPVKQILAVNKDVLGVYRYRLPRPNSSDPFDGAIELYWAVIGLTAGMLGVPVEGLTAVVLAHEMAHAYSHLGSDIDGERWSSAAFSSSEHELKEGLAQYYTYLLSQRLSRAMPAMVEAYDELLIRQPLAYHTHVKWTEENRPEEVRIAMLESRRHSDATNAVFSKALAEGKKRLRKGESNGWSE